jgi:virginiamycin A acetyltransferase
LSVMSTRRLLKGLLFGICLALTTPLIIAAWLEKRLARSEEVFQWLAQSLALVPGLPGVFLRAAYYFGTLDNCSWEVRMGFGSLFTHRGSRVGSQVSTGAYCIIGHTDIGKDVMMGSRVSIPSGRRQHLDESGRLVSQARFDVVAVGSGSWIGEGAIIMANIGQGCIVSAGAVITKAMPDRSLIGGNPAGVIRGLSS